MGDMDDTAPDLADLPEVGDLSSDSLRQLARSGHDVRIPAGWTPIHQSEPADKAYLVLAGHVDVVRGGQLVARLGPGSLAGEMGLVDHRLRNARLSTTEPVRVLAWTKSEFAQLRTDLPDFEAHLQQVTRARHDENAQRS